jgi:hypothetical protein
MIAVFYTAPIFVKHNTVPHNQIISSSLSAPRSLRLFVILTGAGPLLIFADTITVEAAHPSQYFEAACPELAEGWVPRTLGITATPEYRDDDAYLSPMQGKQAQGQINRAFAEAAAVGAQAGN